MPKPDLHISLWRGSFLGGKKNEQTPKPHKHFSARPLRDNRLRDEPPPVPGTNGTKCRFYCGIKQKRAGLSQGRVPICPRKGSRLSQEQFLFVLNTIPPKMFMFIGFVLARHLEDAAAILLKILSCITTVTAQETSTDKRTGTCGKNRSWLGSRALLFLWWGRRLVVGPLSGIPSNSPSCGTPRNWAFWSGPCLGRVVSQGDDFVLLTAMELLHFKVQRWWQNLRGSATEKTGERRHQSVKQAP